MALSHPMTYGVTVVTVTGLFVLFHLLVIVGIVPDAIVWGGRVNDRKKLVTMELLSLSTILLTGAVGFVRALQLAQGEVFLLTTILSWLFFAVFVLNSISNLFAKTAFERFVFTPVTLVLAYIFLRLALAG
ncbi:MAG: hypothetical protein JXK93_03835 [Sphaerochaetaceae bacterium]|nr:hypothetical protein [Sphaerochaetaceae bacterium]